ncbi:MAG TPA: hypothetical protein VJ964_08985 [Balneolaceae bacterium]|nr:hypothetical protein [Balneolaceae bacterium]
MTFLDEHEAFLVASSLLTLENIRREAGKVNPAPADFQIIISKLLDSLPDQKREELEQLEDEQAALI